MKVEGLGSEQPCFFLDASDGVHMTWKSCSYESILKRGLKITCPLVCFAMVVSGADMGWRLSLPYGVVDPGDLAARPAHKCAHHFSRYSFILVLYGAPQTGTMVHLDFLGHWHCSICRQ